MAICVANVVVKIGKQWWVKSHTGKNLGGPYDTKGEAEKRLKQVEYFKHITNGGTMFLQVALNAKTSLVRHDQMEGKDYLVVPCVMLVEGVHNGSGGPIYYPAKELKKTPEVWNYKPVVVYHPRSGSACDPVILTNRKIGVMMNTKWEGGKLKTEAWLDPDRVSVVDNRVAEAIENEEMLELSTGLYLDLDKKPGTWNGEDYDAIATNYRPDHLAVLPDIQGACSLADGAGFLRLNEANPVQIVSDSFMSAFASVLDVVGMVDNELSFDSVRQQLQSALARSMPKGEFVYVQETYKDTFIYERNDTLYKQGYKIKKNVVTLIGIPEQVVRDPVSYSRVTNEKQIQGDKTMKKTELIQSIIDNATTKWGEDDRSALEAMDEATLNKMLPVAVENENKAKDENKVAVENAAKKGAEDVMGKVAITNEKKVTVDEYIANAPNEIQSVLRHGMATFNKQRDTLIDEIVANENNSFTKEYLATKDIEELTNIANLAKGTKGRDEGITRFNYQGQGDAGTVVNKDVTPLTAPKLDFSK